MFPGISTSYSKTVGIFMYEVLQFDHVKWKIKENQNSRSRKSWFPVIFDIILHKSDLWNKHILLIFFSVYETGKNKQHVEVK